MPRPGKVRRPRFITVGDFFERHKKKLGLSLVSSEIGFARKSQEPTINRPGLALAGFYTYFAHRRIQVIGNSERSYLKSLRSNERTKRFKDLCARNIPCIVISRGKTLEPELLEIAESTGISVFQTNMISMKFINAATLLLEADFAPTTSEHGCMIDVKGIGVLVRGKSGTGKSECTLSLVARGASLVADDLVHIRAFENRELIGSSPEVGRMHMEVRGIGIINVPSMFGIGAVRLEKRLDLVVTLRLADEMEDVERVGLRRRVYGILGISVPHVEIPVAPGRDIAQLIEVVALHQKLRSFGYDSAAEFNKKLLKIMGDNTIS